MFAAGEFDEIGGRRRRSCTEPGSLNTAGARVRLVGSTRAEHEHRREDRDGQYGAARSLRGPRPGPSEKWATLVYLPVVSIVGCLWPDAIAMARRLARSDFGTISESTPSSMLAAISSTSTLSGILMRRAKLP